MQRISTVRVTENTARWPMSCACIVSDTLQPAAVFTLTTSMRRFVELLRRPKGRCRTEMGAIDAATLGPFKAQADGHGREIDNSSLCFGCDFAGWYNFGKIIKIFSTTCHILKLKCTAFDVGWGSAGGAYSAPPDPLVGFKGAYF